MQRPRGWIVLLLTGAGCATLEPYPVKDQRLLSVTAREGGVQVARGPRSLDALAPEVEGWLSSVPEAAAAYDHYQAVARLPGTVGMRLVLGPASFTRPLRVAVGQASRTLGPPADPGANAEAEPGAGDALGPGLPLLVVDAREPAQYRLGDRPVLGSELAEVLSTSAESARLQARAEALRGRGEVLRIVFGGLALVGTGGLIGVGEAATRAPEGSQVSQVLAPLAVTSVLVALAGAVGWLIGVGQTGVADAQELEAINAYNDAVLMAEASSPTNAKLPGVEPSRTSTTTTSTTTIALGLGDR